MLVMMRAQLAVALLASLAGTAHCLNNGVGLKPAMGFNT
jgi:hypothetical protein